MSLFGWFSIELGERGMVGMGEECGRWGWDEEEGEE